MAELGDFVAQGRRKNCEVTLEMMDYKHVDTCSDVPELRSILQALKSGEHGKYPHLERHTEKRILGLLPEKDRKKIEGLASTPSAQDVADAANDINAFVGESKEDDDRLRTEVYVKKGGKQLPPVRGRKGPPVTKEVSKPSPEELEAKKENRIPGYDFRAWDKYDVDKECEKLDDKEKAQEEARKRRAREARERDDAKARKALEDLAKCRTELGCDDLAPAERQFLARREKNKGNEAYRASENRDAYDSYTRSLAHDASSAVVFANRAMACLRLGLLERAEDDCTCALKIDPSYHKARQRRGMTRHKRGKYALAIEDFERACADDPDNLALRKLLKQACDKFEEVEGKKADLARDPAAFTAVAIESDDDEDAPQETGFTKIQIADEDSSDEEVVEINATGGFELPSPTEDDVLRKFATMDEDELVVEEVPVAGTKIAIEDDDSVEEVPVKTGGTKVAIEDSSEDEENLLVAETVPESLKPDPPSQGVKVAIEDDDDDEPPPPDVSPAKSSDGSWEVVGDSAKAETLKGEGNELMKKGDVSGAITKYSEALEADAQHYASRANRAMARLRLGDVEGAFLDADACCQHPDVTADVSKRVKALFRRGDARERLAASAATPKAKVVELEASLQDLDDVVALEPRNDVAVAKRRAVSEALSEAKALVREAAQARPPEAASAKTEKSRYEGDFAASDKAKAAGSKALAEGNLDEAEVLYTQALDAWPGNAAARNNRALVRLKRDDFEGCASDTSEVLKSDPKNLKALYRRGVARRALGDFGGSLDDLDALLALAPGDRAATTERDATRRKMDERDGLQRKKTKGVVKLDAVVPSKASLVKPPSPTKKVVAVDAPPPPPSTKALPAPPKQNTEEKIQKAVAAARSRNAKKVPTKAPKTASELERTWRELKSDSELWKEYLGIFKRKTLEKLDLSLCPEVLVDIIGSISGSKAAGVLLGASKAPGWAVTKALLSKEQSPATPLARRLSGTPLDTKAAPRAAPVDRRRQQPLVGAGKKERMLAARRAAAGLARAARRAPAAAPARSLSVLKDLGLDKWQYQLPLGIWLAVPVISNEVLMLSEETQLVGVFAMFCGASYVLGNQAVADMLDAKGKAIIAQHNALEDEAIASIKEVVDAHAGRVALLGELKAISGAQAEALGLLKAAKTMELQHAVRDSIVKKLDTLVAKDELVTAGIQAKLVADAAAAVTGQFASPEVKTKALTEAIDALSSPDAKPALVTDLFAAHFKAAATSAAAKQGKEVELPAAALAELNDELAALAKRDGYDGPVAKMPAKVAA